jgi:hypothetical protein
MFPVLTSPKPTKDRVQAEQRYCFAFGPLALDLRLMEHLQEVD